MKHKLTRLTSLFLALIMSFSMLLVPANAAFSDVPEKAWYAEAVDYVQAHNWMKGISDSSFAPNAEVTRAMFVTVLARYAGAQLNDEQKTKFDDVPSGTWYTGAVAWAAEKGIVNGVSDNAFAPNRAISRQELCTMLYRFIADQGYTLKESESKGFTDEASIAAFAKVAVAYCARTGQPAPQDKGAFARCALESMVLRYREVWTQLEELTGVKRDGLNMIGGATRNALHCQMTADALGIPVLCGPAEGAAAGNVLLQLIAAGELKSLAEGRELIARSDPPAEYRPDAAAAARWDDAYARWLKIKAM